MDAVQLEKDLLERLNADIEVAKKIRKGRPPPTDFIRMLATGGAVETMRTLLDKADPSSGFVNLLIDGRPDLTVEAVALEEKYAQLFTDEQLDKAYQRLKGTGVNPAPPKRRGSTPSKLPAAVTTPTPLFTQLSPPPEALPTGDQRLRQMVAVTARPQQAAFREALRRRYGDGCQVTGCPIMAVIHASHLVSVEDKGTDDVGNGVLLRADVHILFDAHMIGIDPETLVVSVSPGLDATDYASISGTKLRVGQERPNRAALDARWQAFRAASA